MRNITSGIVVAAIILSAWGCYSMVTKPRSYEDCVLKGVSEAKTPVAASLIARACRDKFPSKSFTYEEAFPTPGQN